MQILIYWCHRTWVLCSKSLIKDISYSCSIYPALSVSFSLPKSFPLSLYFSVSKTWAHTKECAFPPLSVDSTTSHTHIDTDAQILVICHKHICITSDHSFSWGSHYIFITWQLNCIVHICINPQTHILHSLSYKVCISYTAACCFKRNADLYIFI